ncbi:MAG: FMN-binding protein [Actinobacteria bacterium]|nr:FMN-binding protein [Actinomycetota bacterium]
MGTLARHLAPAAALGGLAIAIVGLLDPALAAGRSPAGDDMTAMALTDIAAQQGGATAATCDTAETVTGPIVTTRWGPVQVAATIAGDTLCEAHAVVWPTSERQSRQISTYAVPELDAQATQQGVMLDGVSGATYTTEGYRESLQQLVDSL